MRWLQNLAARLYGEWRYLVDWNDPVVYLRGGADPIKRRVFDGLEEATEFARRKAREVGYPVAIAKVVVPPGQDVMEAGLVCEGYRVTPDGQVMLVFEVG